MPFELWGPYSGRYRLPESVRPAQWSVGGSARVRFVRGYGSESWNITLDGAREPEPYELVGYLHTDHNEEEIEDALADLRDAVAEAVSLVHVQEPGDVLLASLALLGSLEITTQPFGVDGTLLRVSIPLLPAESGWRDLTSTELVVV